MTSIATALEATSGARLLWESQFESHKLPTRRPSLSGKAGNDILEGGFGVDTLDGGEDDDTLYGCTQQIADDLVSDILKGFTGKDRFKRDAPSNLDRFGDLRAADGDQLF